MSLLFPAFLHDSGLKRMFWMVGIILLVVGAFGWGDRLFNGHLGANYNNTVVWGLWVAAYIFFIGLSAGAFLISSLVYVFNVKRFEQIGPLAVFTALVTLLMALLAIVVDIGHMGRAWHVMVFGNLQSPMAWMIYLYTAYMILLAFEMWYILRRDLVIGANEPGLRGSVYRFLAFGSTDRSEESAIRDSNIVRVLATIGVPVAVMFHGGVGALFGVVAARPHWHSGIFPIMFLLSALLSGGALLAVVTAVFKEGLAKNRDIVLDLGRLVLFLLAMDVLFQVSEMLVAFRGGIPSHIAGFQLAIFGSQWYIFWIGQVLLGIVLPLFILSSPSMRYKPSAVVMACLLIVLGIFGFRLNVVVPGLAIEEIRGIMDAVHTTRISGAYFPSITEWLLTTGIVGFGLLMFGIGEMLLPEEHQKESKKETNHAIRV